jgi:hypothetical protein
MKAINALLLCALAIPQLVIGGEIKDESDEKGRTVSMNIFTNRGLDDCLVSLRAYFGPGKPPTYRLSASYTSDKGIDMTSVLIYAGTNQFVLPYLTITELTSGRWMEFSSKGLTAVEMRGLCLSERATVHFRGRKRNSEVIIDLEGEDARGFFRAATNAAYQVARATPLSTRALPAAFPRSASTAAGAEIIAATWKVTEQNQSWWRVAYQVQVRNGGSSASPRTIEVKFLDSEGFEIDDERVYNASVSPGETKTFTGSALINVPGAANVKSIKAEFR